MGTKYHTVRTVPKSNRKFIETETKVIPLTHVYITALVSCSYFRIQYTVQIVYGNINVIIALSELTSL